MNKKEFITRVTDALRSNNMRKPVSVNKHTFHITDNEGNAADFVIKRKDKNVIYTIDDVANIVDACLAVIEDAIRCGEDVTMYGYGTLGVKYRAARTTIDPHYKNECEVSARYVPKFTYGKILKTAARDYEMKMKDKSTSQESEAIAFGTDAFDDLDGDE